MQSSQLEDVSTGISRNFSFSPVKLRYGFRYDAIWQREETTQQPAITVSSDAVDMRSSVAVVAILLAAAPSSSLCSGARRSFPRVPTAYIRKRCVSLSEKGRFDVLDVTTCVPGTTFMIDCNKCWCKESGTMALCTTKDCYQELRNDCKPGSIRKVECNICICSSARKWVCTQNQCRPRLKYVDCETDSTHRASVRTSDQICTPGTSFRHNCQWCYCSEDGTSAECSRSSSCDGATMLKNSFGFGEGGPGGGGGGGGGDGGGSGHGQGGGGGGGGGTTGGGGGGGGTSGGGGGGGGPGLGNGTGTGVNWWEVYSNFSGFPSMTGSGGSKTKHTVRDLRDFRYYAIVLSADTQCSPGDVVYRNCFTCYCTGDGDFALCIDPDCKGIAEDPGPLERHLEQHPQVPDALLIRKPVDCGTSPSLFKDDCNYCLCTGKDKNAVCTAWSCPDLKLASSAVSRVKPSSRKCEPLTTYTKDCNTCFCNSNGTASVCTRYDCEVVGQTGGVTSTRIKRETEMAKTCQPMSTFKRGCNTCFCNAEGTSALCTRYNCDAIGLRGDPVAMKNWGEYCLPGTMFMDDCNFCYCNESGTSAVCTDKKCHAGPSLKAVGAERRDVGYAKRCPPNTTFKNKCNTCYCDSDGVIAACSRLDCAAFGLL